VLANLPEVLEKEQPGPKVKAARAGMRPAEGKRAASTRKVDEGSGSLSRLSECAGLENGLYWVIQLVGISQPALVQPVMRGDPRYRCGDCGREMLHRNGSVLAQARRQGWQFLKRLAASANSSWLYPTAVLPCCAFAFGRVISATFVSQVTDSADSKPRGDAEADGELSPERCQGSDGG